MPKAVGYAAKDAHSSLKPHAFERDPAGPPVDNQQVAFARRSVAGSLIGNLAETQEVLDFCAEHGVGPDIEVIDIADVNNAYKKVEKGDVRFRYVIDMAGLKEEAAA